MMKKQEAMGNALRAGRHALSKEVPVGYKQTGLSVLPSGWSTCTLGEIGQCLIGLTYEPKNVGSDGLLVLRSSNIGDGTLQFDDHVFVNMEVPERIIVCEDDLLICVRNGSRPLIGKCALIDHRAIGMTFGAFMSVFRSPDNRFVFYCFQSDIVKHQIHEHLGATINQITNRSLSSFQIPYPGAEERDAIADALSDVDGLLRALEALIVKKRAIKQAAMQQLLTGKTRLPGFSGEWEMKRLGDIASFFKGSGLSKADLSLGGRRRCVHYGELFTVYGERITKVLHGTDREGMFFYSIRNDVLMPTSDVTPNGLATASCILTSDIIIGGDILVIRTPKSLLNGEFLAYTIKTHRNQVMQLVSGTTVFHLYGRDMATFGFPAPSVEEQTAIAVVLSDMDAEIAALERRRDKTRAIKQGMMQQLLIGRVRLVGVSGNE